MNKIEALNEKALEAARKAVKAAAVYDPVADVSTLADHAIRAYLTASDAEREPAGYCTKNAIDALLKKIPGAPVFLMPDASGPYSVPLYTDPLPLTDLEAENARLRARLAEALKALEPVNRVAGEFLAKADAEGWQETSLVGALFSVAEIRAARRVREGGKVDG